MPLRARRRPAAQTGAGLAALADVGPAPADDHLHDRRAAAQARLALAQMHQEPVLEAPLTPSAWRKSSIDAPRASMPARSAATTRRAAARTAPRVSFPGRRSGWMPRAEQRLVGVDVADARDVTLVEQERLDRRLAPARHRAQVLARELCVQRLESEPRARGSVAAPPRPAAARPCRSAAGRRSPGAGPARARSARACAAAPGPGRAAACRSSAGAAPGDVAAQAPEQVLAAPAQRLHAPPPQRVLELPRRQRARPARVRRSARARVAGPRRAAPAGL